METKDWFEYMDIYEEIVELFGRESIDEETAALDLTEAEMARLRRYRRDVGGLPPVELTA